jgi:DNA processing protein
MPLAWIALNSVKGLGPVRIKHLIDALGSAGEVFKRSPGELARRGLVPEQCVEQLSDKALFTGAEAQLAWVEKEGAAVLTLASKEYPAYLKEIFAPPPVLFVKGDRSVFSHHGVAVVGTRAPTPYGKSVAGTLTAQLVERGLVIVSGLARGVDTIAHQTAIDRGGRTIAVLGCGLDRVYPAQNGPLAEKICKGGGAVVSEFPMGTPPESFNFPRRNRIISGLSAGILFVEGGERSGGLITAHFAVQQGRDVFAVPGPITSPQSNGPFNLIKEGATPARSGYEIAEALSLIENPQIKTADPAAGLVLGVPLSLLSDQERQVYDRLSGTPVRIDELAETTGKTVMQLFDALLNLELKGLTRQISGQQFVRA